MNQSEIETKKRLIIAQTISNQIKHIATAAYLGGSMGYGQNFSVHEKSDIDFVIICNKDKLNEFLQTKYFQNQVPDNVQKLFKENEISTFWVQKEINNIEVNCFIYEETEFKNLCTLKSDIKCLTLFKPAEVQNSFGFRGQKIQFQRPAKKIENGYMFTKPILVEDQYWGGPPRDDFFYAIHIMFDNDEFLLKLKEDIWAAVINQMKIESKQSQNPNEYNIRNTIHRFKTTPERVPKEIMDRLDSEIKLRLK